MVSVKKKITWEGEETVKSLALENDTIGHSQSQLLKYQSSMLKEADHKYHTDENEYTAKQIAYSSTAK